MVRKGEMLAGDELGAETLLWALEALRDPDNEAEPLGCRSVRCFLDGETKEYSREGRGSGSSTLASFWSSLFLFLDDFLSCESLRLCEDLCFGVSGCASVCDICGQ